MGKGDHHCVMIDEQAERLFSRRVLSEKPFLLEMIGDVSVPSGDALWVLDVNHGGRGRADRAPGRSRPMVHITGLAVHQALTAHRGQGETDEKDTFVIADLSPVPRVSGQQHPQASQIPRGPPPGPATALVDEFEKQLVITGVVDVREFWFWLKFCRGGFERL